MGKEGQEAVPNVVKTAQNECVTAPNGIENALK